MHSWMSALGERWIFHVPSHCLRVGPAWLEALRNKVGQFVVVNLACFSCFPVGWGTKAPAQRGSTDGGGGGVCCQGA